jgi:acetoin utilization deacetylase AcuC-like enzyme
MTIQPRLFYCDHYQIPLPSGHKFPMAKYRLLREALAADGVYRLDPAHPAGRETVMTAHDEGYVSAFLGGTIDPAMMRRIGFPWSRELVQRTFTSVGATMSAAEDALRTGFGGTLAGGTHHAFRGEGAGFCVFNDIAVAILSCRRAGRVRRAAVVDLDVHQGDGTAAIFRDDPDVLTLSIHGRNNFPLRKQQSSIDIELADGTGDVEYLAGVGAALERVFTFEPEIVFYQSGVDALAGDRLGRLALTLDGLKRRDELVCESCRRHDVPIVITLGGGYAEPITRTVEAHANTFRAAAEKFFGVCTGTYSCVAF